MLTAFLPKQNLLRKTKTLTKPVFLFSQAVTWMVYGFVRILFYQFHFSLVEESTLLIRTFLYGIRIAGALLAATVVYEVLKKWTVRINVYGVTRLAFFCISGGYDLGWLHRLRFTRHGR